MAIKPEDLMDQDDVAAVLGMTTGRLRNSRALARAGRNPHNIEGLPEPIRLVGHCPVWDAKEVTRYAKARARSAARAPRRG